MSSWAIVALVAIVMWGFVEIMKAKHGVTTDMWGNESKSSDVDPEAQREIEDLRERIKVLERIATEGNSLDVRETKRISAEIEALRDKQAD